MPLPLAVIGGGSIGLRHAQVSMTSDAVTLTAVVEPDPERRAALEMLGLPVAAEIAALPRDTRAAIVATPTAAHHDSASEALDLGCAVLVEKPVTHTLGEADALCAQAEAAGLPLLTGHHRRCHAFVTEARARLAQIGDLVAVQGIWSMRKHDSYFDVPWRRAPGAGPILTNLSHDLDMLRYLMGDIAEVTAMTSSAQRGLAVEDTAAIALRFASGAMGTFLLSDAGASPWSFEGGTDENPALAYSGQDSLKLVGTLGAMSFPSLDLWMAAPGQSAEWRQPLQHQKGPRLLIVDPLAVQVARFAERVESGGAPELASGRDGRETLAATLAISLSARKKRPVRPEDVPEDFTGGEF